MILRASAFGQQLGLDGSARQPKTRLRGPVGSPEFLIDYQHAASGQAYKQKKKDKVQAKTGQPGTLRWLCTQYLESPMYRQLDPSTRQSRRSILERFCQNHGHGEKPYTKLLPRHLRMRRDEMLKTSSAE